MRLMISKSDNAASVTPVCRFYYLLANGRLLNEKRSKQMLSIMETLELHHKFVNILDVIAPKARLFRKSRSWKTYHSDSFLVWRKESNRRYILVALVDPDGEQIIRNLVKPIEKVLKTPKFSHWIVPLPMIYRIANNFFDIGKME
ncbi:serine hydrolase [Flagellimonas sp.]|uniref:serine hydrolase n=2 Tax=Flagellimonas sp. TaxID=2058762 RepID=UPI003AB34C05